ncbi:helix-turn-helix domain-containing protein [Roseomonas sp. 18066]|uniref:helix-turn-helix domain-containing protein n=1 Tax=Roseomonas sp. 18066 TaxID=2681412 RepID=UPI00135A2F3B|nr:cupin domain-containing protein [Roseomonas sp. 18066]
MKGEELGARLKRLRGLQGMTLVALGGRSGVAISTLSKIENGQVSPVYGTLRKIAVGLGIPFEQLIADQPAEAPRPAQVLTRAGDTADFRHARYAYAMHAAQLEAKAMLPIVMTIDSAAPPAAGEWSSHAGEEFLFVLEGSVEVHLQGQPPLLLGRGDSLYIDSRVPHGFVRHGRGKARLVSVTYDPGQAARRPLGEG